MFDTINNNLSEERDTTNEEGAQEQDPLQDELATYRKQEGKAKIGDSRAKDSGTKGVRARNSSSPASDAPNNKDSEVQNAEDSDEDSWLDEILLALGAAGLAGAGGYMAKRALQQPTARADRSLSIGGRTVSLEPGRSVAVDLIKDPGSGRTLPQFFNDPNQEQIDRSELTIRRDSKGNWYLSVPKADDKPFTALTRERLDGNSKKEIKSGKIRNLKADERLTLGPDGLQLTFNKSSDKPKNTPGIEVINSGKRRIVIIGDHEPIPLGEQRGNKFGTLGPASFNIVRRGGNRYFADNPDLRSEVSAKIVVAPHDAAQAMGIILPIIDEDRSVRSYTGVDPNLVMGNAGMSHPDSTFPSNGILFDVKFNNVQDAFNFQNKVAEALSHITGPDPREPSKMVPQLIHSANAIVSRDLYRPATDGTHSGVVLESALIDAICRRAGKSDVSQLKGEDLNRIGLDGERITFATDGQLMFVPTEQKPEAHKNGLIELSNFNDTLYLNRLTQDFLGTTQAELCLEAERVGTETAQKLSLAIISGDIRDLRREFDKLRQSTDPGKLIRHLNHNLGSSGIKATGGQTGGDGHGAGTITLHLSARKRSIDLVTDKFPVANRTGQDPVSLETDPHGFQRRFDQMADLTRTDAAERRARATESSRNLHEREEPPIVNTAGDGNAGRPPQATGTDPKIAAARDLFAMAEKITWTCKAKIHELEINCSFT